MKFLILHFVLLTVFLGGLFCESVELGAHRLHLGKCFQVIGTTENRFCKITTPQGHPVMVKELDRISGIPWESRVLEHLLTTVRLEDPRITATDTIEEVRLKHENTWTTIYWTYGGTKAYFGMFLRPEQNQDSTLVVWADPEKAPGRAQYQALSEVIKGIIVENP